MAHQHLLYIPKQCKNTMRVLQCVYRCIAVILYATCASAVDITYDTHTLSNGTVIYVPDFISMRYLMRTFNQINAGLVQMATRNMTIVDRDRGLNGLPMLYTVGMNFGNATVSGTVSSSTVAATTIISALPTITTSIVQQNHKRLAKRSNLSWIHRFK
ncbi:hypothetical protein V1523DRAFT_413020 [Lipomyces doorenjongii]